MTFTLGQRVRIANLPDHTFNERKALEGLEATIIAVPGNTRYYEVKTDAPVQANGLYETDRFLLIQSEIKNI